MQHPGQDPETTAVEALREAGRVLAAGSDADSTDTKITELEKPHVAHEVAVVLDAIARLLHQIDLNPMPFGGAGHSLHAVTQHLNAGAELARRVAERQELIPPTSGHPEARLDAD